VGWLGVSIVGLTWVGRFCLERIREGGGVQVTGGGWGQGGVVGGGWGTGEGEVWNGHQEVWGGGVVFCGRGRKVGAGVGVCVEEKGGGVWVFVVLWWGGVNRVWCGVGGVVVRWVGGGESWGRRRLVASSFEILGALR